MFLTTIFLRSASENKKLKKKIKKAFDDNDLSVRLMHRSVSQGITDLKLM
ncbi:MAG: hypothetical protein KatS3mg104_0850 [Phycisphaerae bacterium]|nr:MAG: hypothetical protein KatS3mg104_0850 [Phycisphaerae bacterium]